MSMDEETWAHGGEEERHGCGHGWTFAALVGAFVDLAVAHLLLLAAATTFLASRFLSLFGLRLPSFSSYQHLWCLRSLLSRVPHGLRLAAFHSSLASLHSSLASRAPFHAACPSCLALRLALDDSHSRGSVKRDGVLLIRGPGEDSGEDGSCSSDTAERRLGSRNGLRRRRRRGRERSSGESESRNGLVDGLGNSAIPLPGWEEGSGLPRRARGPVLRGVSEGSCSPVFDPALRGNGEFFGSNSLHLVVQTTSDDTDVGGHSGSKTIEKENLPDQCKSPEEMIKFLEKALEEERSARAALYLDLEKERNASATAADEAMAMIERLQNEKASINMDAKQYQRMIEEKAAYDEEEMELLKEIIVRQEEELLLMGKEVEKYRQIMPGGVKRQEEDDGHPETVELSGQVLNTLREAEQSLSMTLPHVPQTAEMRKKVMDDNGGASYGPLVLEKKSSSYGRDKRLLSRGLTEGSILQGNQTLGDSRKHTIHPDVKMCANDDHLDFQEKGIVSVGVYMSPAARQNPGVVDTLSLCGVDVDHRHDFQQEMLLAVDTRKSCSSIESGSEHVGALKKNALDKSSGGIDPYISCTETDPSTFDVHVIDDKIAFCRREDANDDVSCVDRDSMISQGSHLSCEPDGIRNVEILNDNSCRSSNAEEPHIERSCSDASRASALSILTSPLESKSSMSAVNDERSKLETEVEDLRRRLKIVQQGRKKLNFSAENMEKESFHLQLLDEIALQLREIKQSTQHDKAIRRTSLPPPSFEANTKEKRRREESHEVYESSS